MNINLYPKGIFKVNLYLILFLLCANTLGIVFKYGYDHPHVYGFVGSFDFNTERNIPTIYSSIALLVSSILLLSIALTHKKTKSSYIQWLVLSFIFLFLSLDELFLIHERFGRVTPESVKKSSLLYYAWVVPYGIALAVFVIAYLRFLFKLPKNIMILFLVSGAMFVSGAIGFEMLGGRQDSLYGVDNILYAIFYTFEELLEMLGIALFIYTLLTHIVNEFELISITIDRKIN